MRHLGWIVLIACVTTAPVAPGPSGAPAFAKASADKQDMLAMTEKELMNLNSRLEKTYRGFLGGKVARQELSDTMKEIKYDLKKRSWDSVGGDAKIRAALMHLSKTLSARADWLQPQRSFNALEKGSVNWDRLHDVELALLNLRVTRLELKKP